jgi:stage III sporulation protein AE
MDKCYMKNKRGYKGKIIFCVYIVIVLTTILNFSTQILYAADEVNSGGAETDAIIEGQTQTGEIKKIEEELDRYSENGLKELIPEFDPQKIISKAAKGKFEFSFTGILNKIMASLFKEVYINIDILIKLVILTVFCSILKNLQTSFLSDSVGELAFYACYVVIVSVIIISLNTVVTLGNQSMDNMVEFMHATIPVLITLLVSGGNLTSAGVFQPVLIMIVEVCATLIKNVFLPLISLALILTVVDNISDKIQVSRLAQFFKQICIWSLGLILTIFVAILTIQGSLGAVVDGVTSKTAKFAIGALIPVAGKYLADAADTVLGCTLLIKNAAGIAAMIGIIGICIMPLIKIFALIALYKITCILIEPIADKRITNCLNEMASTLTYILGISASVALMFLISITAIIGASNLSSMIR